MTYRLLTPNDFPALIDALAGAELLYVDTEFHSEHRYHPRLYVLQVAADDGPVWLVDAADRDALAVLGPAMRSAPWVVHGGAHDIAILNRALGGVPERIWDTQILAGLVDSAFPKPFQALVAQYTGTQLAKAATLSNWKRRPLSEEQLTYAADDVQWLRPLFAALMTAVDARDRRVLAGAACDHARAEALSGPDPDQAWRRLHAARALDPERASILRELAAWRERSAVEDDQPPRHILHDGVLFEIARSAPETVEELASHRRFSKRVLSEHGEALTAAIARGRRRAQTEPAPFIQRFSDHELAVEWLALVARIAGRTDAWSPDLVLPLTVRQDCVLASPASLPERLGWRADLALPLVERALHGDLTAQRVPDGWIVR